jgi:hypothetical protein
MDVKIIDEDTFEFIVHMMKKIVEESDNEIRKEFFRAINLVVNRVQYDYICIWLTNALSFSSNLIDDDEEILDFLRREFEIRGIVISEEDLALIKMETGCLPPWAEMQLALEIPF